MCSVKKAGARKKRGESFGGVRYKLVAALELIMCYKLGPNGNDCLINCYETD